MDEIPLPDGYPEGYPEVPSYVVSDACLWYMTQRTEHREYNALHHDLARRAFRWWMPGRKELYRRYRLAGHFHLESFLCRYHDIVRLYWQQIGIETVAQNPGLLIKGADADTLLEQKLLRNELAKGLLNAAVFLGERLGSLTLSEHETNTLSILSTLRNVIVHSDALPDTKFERRLQGADVEFTELPGGRIGLNEPWVLSVPRTLEPLIFRFDDAVVRAHKTGRHFRYGTVWIRSIPLPLRESGS